MTVVFVSHVFRDNHPVSPWRYEVGGDVKTASRGRTEEQVARLRATQIAYLETRHEVIEVDVGCI